MEERMGVLVEQSPAKLSEMTLAPAEGNRIFPL